MDNKKIWLEKDMYMINIAAMPGFSVDFLEIFPSAIEENVYHDDCDEWIYVIEGTLVFFKDGQEIELKQGEYISIPKNTVHGSINKTDSSVKILAVCNPPFQLDFMKKVE